MTKNGINPLFKKTVFLKNVVIISILIAFFFTIIMGCSNNSSDSSSSTTGVDYSSTIKETSELINKLMIDNNVTGVSIALVDDQKVVWQNGFGYADKANKVPVTAETIFQIGSNGKPIAATAVMQLAEQGKIDIDKPLGAYLSDFNIQSRYPDADSNSVTPRLLMTHHAGIPYNSIWMSSYTFLPQLMEEVPNLLKKDWLCSKPDTIYSYSNIGCTLCALLVERVTGSDYVTYTDKHIFAPMNMQYSSFSPKSYMKPYLTKSYDANGVEMQNVFVNYLPAGSALSSASDMSHFIMTMLANGNYQGNPVIRPETLQEMWMPQNINVPLDFDYRVGLFWILTDPEIKYAGRVAEYAGDTSQQHSKLLILPDHKLGVIVLSNSVSGGGIVRPIAIAAIEKALAAKTGIYPPALPSPEPTSSLPPEKLSPYVGLYSGMQGGGIVNISVEGDHLLANSFSGISYKIVPTVNGNFRIIGLPGMEDHQFIFDNISGYDVLCDIWNGTKLLPLLTKINPSKIKQAWIERCGSYELDEPGEFYPFYKNAELSNFNGILTLIINKTAYYYALDTVTDTQAINLGLGTYYGDTIRIETGADGEERLVFQNYTFKKITDKK